MTNEELMIDRFHKVKECGWVKSRRKNNTGIGKTFEDYVGVVENNLDKPDLFGYEIKSHRSASSSFVTLFTKSPSYPRRGANAKLRDSFGDCYEENPKLKRLHTSIYADKFNVYNNKYLFRLEVDDGDRRIYVAVYDMDSRQLINREVYYTFDDIGRIIHLKLKELFFVKADSRHDENGVEEFKFTEAEIYSNPSFECFVRMLREGKIRLDIRIGSYKTGIRIGKPHDHGSGFRIKECDIEELYADKKSVN